MSAQVIRSPPIALNMAKHPDACRVETNVALAR
jgi:hypothetical protein